MAGTHLRADSAPDNLIRFPVERRSTPDRAPEFNPANPAHRDAWQAMWRFAQGSLRRSLEQTIEAQIELLDTIDGDPDLELNGDESDYSQAEDDFLDPAYVPGFGGPGCPIADPDSCPLEMGELDESNP